MNLFKISIILILITSGFAYILLNNEDLLKENTNYQKLEVKVIQSEIEEEKDLVVIVEERNIVDNSTEKEQEQIKKVGNSLISIGMEGTNISLSGFGKMDISSRITQIDFKKVAEKIGKPIHIRPKQPEYHKIEVESYSGEYFDLDLLSSTPNGCYDETGSFKRYQHIEPQYDYEEGTQKSFKCKRNSFDEYYWELLYY